MGKKTRDSLTARLNALSPPSWEVFSSEHDGTTCCTLVLYRNGNRFQASGEGNTLEDAMLEAIFQIEERVSQFDALPEPPPPQPRRLDDDGYGIVRKRLRDRIRGRKESS